MIFLDNPKHKKKTRAKVRSRRSKRAVPSGFKSWKAYMDHIRSFKKGGTHKMAKKRGKKKHRSNPKHRVKSYTRHKKGGGVVHVKSHMSNPTRKKSRRHRRNPPRGIMRGFGGFPNLIFNGLIDGTEVLAGRYGAKTVPHMIGYNTGIIGILVELASAVGVGWVGDRFISKNAGKMFLAGGFSAVAESLIVTFNVPILSQLTMPVPVAAGAIAAPAPTAALPAPGVSAYPMLSLYPQSLGDGEEEEMYGEQ